MAAKPAKRRAVHEDLYSIPEGMTGEIINGEIIATPRPSRKHIYAASALDKRIGAPYQFGEGAGPGGWVILVEPEIGLGENILVPDLAGWRKERYPWEEPHNWISVAPDWICEILSPGSMRRDKTDKMTIYARHDVQHLWLLDPLGKTLDAFRLETGKWFVTGSFFEDDKVRIEPFADIEINLSDLWQEAGLKHPAQDASRD